MNIQLEDYIGGGFFLVKSSPRPDWMDADLMPERILSLYNFLCPSVHLRWAWDADDAREHFGIVDIHAPELRGWDQDAEFEYPNVFLSLQAAHRYLRDSRMTTEHVHLLGIGLPRELVATFLAGPFKQQVYDPHSQTSKAIICGTGSAITRGNSLPPGRTALGFEVLAHDGAIQESWLVAGIDREMQRLYDIRPNAHGLLNSIDEAMQVYQWIAEDEQQGRRGEPAPYYPWLLVDYPLEADAT